MTNIYLWGATTLIYWFVLQCWMYPKDRTESTLDYLSDVILTTEGLKSFGVVALLCLPLNINGNVFTFFGNVHNQGVKNVYSVWSLYQTAENDAFSMIGTAYQKAGRDATVILVGSVYQEAGRDALVGIGLSGFQKAGHDANVAGGIVFRQTSANNSLVFMGVSLVQKAGECACSIIGVNLIQNGKQAGVGLGLSVYQHGSETTETYVSMALYQRAGNQVRNFAVWSQMGFPDNKKK